MIIQGDCVEKMRELDEASVDAIVTDPPYGLEFMGKEWDRLQAPGRDDLRHRRRMDVAPDSEQGNPWASERKSYGTVKKNPRCKRCERLKFDHEPRRCHCEQPDWDLRLAESAQVMQTWHHTWATEALRILKPGGHLLAFGGTRTYHRLACAVEDAGFEIRDSLIWLYGSGFPKSLDVSKAIDKRGGADIGWFGPWLREERGRRKITQKELATHFLSKTGGLTGCVANWELGFNLPTPEQFNKLCEVLDLPFDRVEEAEREVLRERTMVQGGGNSYQLREGERRNVEANVTAPATPEAAQWEGWGTALKPSHEPIVVARKPLVGTVVANVLEHGTGALNVDGTRIGTDEKLSIPKPGTPGADPFHKSDGSQLWNPTSSGAIEREQNPAGRWPSNVVLSHLPECEQVGVRKVKGSVNHHDSQHSFGGESGIYSPGAPRTGHDYVNPDGTETIPAYECAPGCPVSALDAQSGESTSRQGEPRVGANGEGWGMTATGAEYGDSGGASRFFYTAKASRAERNAGLDGFEEKPRYKKGGVGGTGGKRDVQVAINTPPVANHHPTVKPIDLMRWLVRLVTPPGGTVLDPFAGSGTTGVAVALEGFDFLGIEREAEYVAIAEARIAWWTQFPGEDTTEILIRNGLSERIEREHAESGQLGLLDPD